MKQIIHSIDRNLDRKIDLHEWTEALSPRYHIVGDAFTKNVFSEADDPVQGYLRHAKVAFTNHSAEEEY